MGVASAKGICVGARPPDTSSWLSIKYGFIDVLLNFVETCSSFIITDLPYILRKL